MSPTPHRAGRLTAVSVGVATAALAIAGLALSSSPTEAAPQAAPKTKLGYTGAPVNPAPYTVTQPDGTTLRVRNFGDHLSHGVATVKGSYTLVKGSDGYWRYAAGLTAKGGIRASSIIAGHGTAPKASRGLAPAPSAKDTPPRAPKAGVGDDNELVILVSFADQDSVGSTPDDWADKYFGADGSVDAFYDEASGGLFGLAPASESSGVTDDGVIGWLELPYDHPDTGLTNGSDDYVADAIDAANPFVNYASFDANHDGELTTDELHVTVIGAGYETSYSGPDNACGPSIWGHEWDLASAGVTAPTVDGVTVGDSGYTTFGEWHCDTVYDDPGHMATIGIMAHEFGHDISWPDLYDGDYSSEGIGEWSLMSGGSWGYVPTDGQEFGESPAHPDAWALWYQGWITPDEITTQTDNVDVPVGDAVLVSPNPGDVDWEFGEQSGTGEYFLVENRRQIGFDSSIPGCGLVVYRIDETVTSGNAANSDEDDPLVKVIEADGENDLYLANNRGDEGDPYPGSKPNHDLSDTTTPNALFDDGSPSGLALHVDSNACAATMTMDVTPGNVSPPHFPPANDMFTNAVTVSGASGSVDGSSEHATEEAGEPFPEGCGLASVWYRWTAPASGNVTLSTATSNYDTVLGLYTGSAVNTLTEVAANDDEDYPVITTSAFTTHVTGGTTYQIAVDGCAGETGALHLAWNLVADPTPTVTPTVTPTPTPTPTTVPAPPNDKFASPEKLKGKHGKTDGTTDGAGVEAKEDVFKAGKGGEHSVWFTWKAKKDGKVTIKATGDFKPLLAVTKGESFSQLDVLESDTSGSAGEVTVKVKEGKTYRILLDGKHGGSGSYALSWKFKS